MRSSSQWTISLTNKAVLRHKVYDVIFTYLRTLQNHFQILMEIIFMAMHVDQLVSNLNQLYSALNMVTPRKIP